jgi:cell volume regulation protein A
MDADVRILVGALLLLGGVLLSKTSSRVGVPSLLLFLGLGMAAGSDGLVGIEFDDVELARSLGVVALALILFSGGLGTQWHDVRTVLKPGLAMATVGVMISATTLGLLASLILDLTPLQGLLLGGIIASTDAAAVFSVLRSRGVRLGTRLRSLLELESGSNDPAAVFLTIGLISFIQSDGTTVVQLVWDFVVQMSLGVAAGWGAALGVVWLINRLRLEVDGLYPIISLAAVLVVFEAVTWLGGSGFLATYVMGVAMANREFLHRRSMVRFHDAVGWLMQIAMFVVLGLLVFPSDLPEVVVPALVVAALLMFVARPLATALTLAPFRMPWREQAFVSWVGLRGATPIILATFPVVAGIPDADTIFNVVFFVVLTSVLVQGTTISTAATRLGLAEEGEAHPVAVSFDAVISGDTGHNLHEVRLVDDAPAAGNTLMDLGLPAQVLVVLVRRGEVSIMPQGNTRLQSGDELLVFADTPAFESVRHLFGPGPLRHFDDVPDDPPIP